MSHTENYNFCLFALTGFDLYIYEIISTTGINENDGNVQLGALDRLDSKISANVDDFQCNYGSFAEGLKQNVNIHP